MMYSYKTKGTCSRQIDVELDGDVIKDVKFYGGCNGNLQGISAIVRGKTVEEVMHDAANVLTKEQVMEGVADMIDLLQVEAVFTDGSRLVSIHHPIK